MRGKAIDFSFGVVEDRITPAYAGKRSDLFLNIRQSVGSPPPMRGKATGGNNHSWFVRITPAYAGKSDGLC